MKKLIPLCICAIFTLSMTTNAQSIKLPAPTKKGGMPLYQVMMNRQTNRNFSSKNLTDQQMSDLLWCANGVNRSDGRRTAPSARNCQEIDIYVFTEKGVFLYEANENVLKMVVGEDHRAEVATRGDFAAKAPVVLVFLANYDKMDGMDEEAREFYGATDCGYVSQNVYLYCAANQLNTVVMGSVQREGLLGILGGPNGKIILAQLVGYPEK